MYFSIGTSFAVAGNLSRFGEPLSSAVKISSPSPAAVILHQTQRLIFRSLDSVPYMSALDPAVTFLPDQFKSSAVFRLPVFIWCCFERICSPLCCMERNFDDVAFFKTNRLSVRCFIICLQGERVYHFSMLHLI